MTKISYIKQPSLLDQQHMTKIEQLIKNFGGQQFISSHNSVFLSFFLRRNKQQKIHKKIRYPGNNEFSQLKKGKYRIILSSLFCISNIFLCKQLLNKKTAQSNK
jgi:hypothetical protein